MNNSALKKFAQEARRQLLTQVTARLDQILSMDSAEIREKEKTVNELKEQISRTSKEAVIDRVAYTWFNRFCALRFMDVNRYTNIGTVSPVKGYSQPEILQEAKQGHIDEGLDRFVDKQKVYALLSGKIPSSDPQQEAYRLLLVGVCNSYHSLMPFMFQRIEDYTELLMPEDLLSQNAIIQAIRDALTEENCKDVEVIGWLYQFYISEKKDEVFDGLKKNKKITPENIPAATQLFTPHWIVRYLVENSLGRLWMLNRPKSRVVEQMDYYIKPEQPETDFLKIGKPEEIKICDPACGSGHMLTYAFDLLYAIYEEEGYEPAVIPEMILNNNLYGIEIDERAGELAAFALTMKARAKQRRFFRKPVQPNICVLESIHFEKEELKSYMDFVGRDLFTAPLETTLRQFDEADNFGSLIRPKLMDVRSILKILEEEDVSGDLFLSSTHEKVMQVLEQTDYLSPKYHVVIANPPYMGASNANIRLKSWLTSNYPEEKRDLFAAFIDRNLKLSMANGFVAMITMQNWMFISRYENFRVKLLSYSTLLSMAHLGERAFDSIGGEVVSTTAFVVSANSDQNCPGVYVRLTEGKSESEKANLLIRAAQDQACGYVYTARIVDFHKIPGDPLAYWVPNSLRVVFASHPSFDSVLESREGLTTGKNDDYVLFSFEVSNRKVFRSAIDRKQAIDSGCKWFPYNKGGEKRKWYGNDEFVLNWENDGEMLQTRKHPSGDRIWAHNFNLDYIFCPSISWSDITTKGLSARLFPNGYLFDATGLSAFNRTAEDWRFYVAGICNSKVGTFVSSLLNPTLHFKSGDFSEIPLVRISRDFIEKQADSATKISTVDWHAYETSWDFTSQPLLQPGYRQSTLKTTYQKLRTLWLEMTLEMQRLEEENNRIFIEAYGLQDELTPDVPLHEITLTCNPHYRYGNEKSEDDLEALLLADTIRELVSYAVGCMFGRYALEKPGLILANQGETIEDYLDQIPESSFPADDDNVIPILDGDWFIDDIADRFRRFLRVTYGEEYYEENLKYLEKAIGKDIRKYFLKDFYNHHVKMYKKRPIYWMFSSPKGSFNALIYMHRYRPDTVSIVLNDYLREFRTKINSKKENLEKISSSLSSSQRDKTNALKEIEKLKKIMTELEDYERDVLYPLATKQIEIDLDDGVKVNYNKFGKALKKVPGLSK